ncbi:hypothetical protein ACJZQZ_000583 [Enterococcus hirae]
MGDGAWGFLGVIFSVIVSWCIAHKNLKNTVEQNQQNRKIQEKLEKNQRDFQNSINKSRIEFEREMTQKQIDANLKAKARIEWISEVRRLVSEYLVVIHKVGELLFLLKENNIKKKQEIRRNQSTLGKDSREILESNKQYAIETDLNEKEHEKIRKSLNNIKGIIIDIYNKAYGTDISETYYDEKSPILNENSEELSEEIGKYLKIEWDRAKKGE